MNAVTGTIGSFLELSPWTAGIARKAATLVFVGWQAITCIGCSCVKLLFGETKPMKVSVAGL